MTEGVGNAAINWNSLEGTRCLDGHLTLRSFLFKSNRTMAIKAEKMTSNPSIGIAIPSLERTVAEEMLVKFDPGP